MPEYLFAALRYTVRVEVVLAEPSRMPDPRVILSVTATRGAIEPYFSERRVPDTGVVSWTFTPTFTRPQYLGSRAKQPLRMTCVVEAAGKALLMLESPPIFIYARQPSPSHPIARQIRPLPSSGADPVPPASDGAVPACGGSPAPPPSAAAPAPAPAAGVPMLPPAVQSMPPAPAAGEEDYSVPPAPMDFDEGGGGMAPVAVCHATECDCGGPVLWMEGTVAVRMCLRACALPQGGGGGYPEAGEELEQCGSGGCGSACGGGSCLDSA